MSKPKSRTEQAMLKQRAAYTERRCRNSHILAPMYERQAAELLVLPNPPDVGPGGEVVPEQTRGLGLKRSQIRETLTQDADRTAEDASIQRVDLLLLPSFNAVALAIDAAESIQAGNSLEKMLAHQMAVAHEASMRLIDRALSYEVGERAMRQGDSVEACRLANAAARLMSVFQDDLLTLQKLRTGGNQTVTVQHVTVAAGAQAVIGNVRAGGASAGGSKPNRG